MRFGVIVCLLLLILIGAQTAYAQTKSEAYTRIMEAGFERQEEIQVTISETRLIELRLKQGSFLKEIIDYTIFRKNDEGAAVFGRFLNNNSQFLGAGYANALYYPVNERDTKFLGPYGLVEFGQFQGDCSEPLFPNCRSVGHAGHVPLGIAYRQDFKTHARDIKAQLRLRLAIGPEGVSFKTSPGFWLHSDHAVLRPEVGWVSRSPREIHKVFPYYSVWFGGIFPVNRGDITSSWQGIPLDTSRFDRIGQHQFQISARLYFHPLMLNKAGDIAIVRPFLVPVTYEWSESGQFYSAGLGFNFVNFLEVGGGWSWLIQDWEVNGPFFLIGLDFAEILRIARGTPEDDIFRLTLYTSKVRFVIDP